MARNNSTIHEKLVKTGSELDSEGRELSLRDRSTLTPPLDQVEGSLFQ